MHSNTRRLDAHVGCARLAFEDDWTPIRYISNPDPQRDLITWARIGTGPFPSPFFDQDVAERLPDAEWFVSQANQIHAYALNHPGVPLRGLIWHMSRCGSTLARNLLAETDAGVSLGEPGLVNSIVARAINDNRDSAFNGLLSSALGSVFRPDNNALLRGYVKCTSWNVLAARSIHEALPKVPTIFIHRDPLMVMASLERGGAGFMATPEMFHGHHGIRHFEDTREQTANILAGFLRAGLDAEAGGFCRLVSYTDIVTRMIDGDLPDYFGYEVGQETRTRMHASSLRQSKSPTREFAPDEEKKRDFAKEIPGLLASTNRHLRELYEEVETRSQWD